MSAATQRHVIVDVIAAPRSSKSKMHFKINNRMCLDESCHHLFSDLAHESSVICLDVFFLLLLVFFFECLESEMRREREPNNISSIKTED